MSETTPWLDAKVTPKTFTKYVIAMPLYLIAIGGVLIVLLSTKLIDKLFPETSISFIRILLGYNNDKVEFPTPKPKVYR